MFWIDRHKVLIYFLVYKIRLIIHAHKIVVVTIFKEHMELLTFFWHAVSKQTPRTYNMQRMLCDCQSVVRKS